LIFLSRVGTNVYRIGGEKPLEEQELKETLNKIIDSKRNLGALVIRHTSEKPFKIKENNDQNESIISLLKVIAAKTPKIRLENCEISKDIDPHLTADYKWEIMRGTNTTKTFPIIELNRAPVFEKTTPTTTEEIGIVIENGVDQLFNK
jgi:hypothetical protein